MQLLEIMPMCFRGRVLQDELDFEEAGSSADGVQTVSHRKLPCGDRRRRAGYWHPQHTVVAGKSGGKFEAFGLGFWQGHENY